MNVTWIVEGAGWQAEIKSDSETNPSEIATQAIEDRIKLGEDTELGMVLILSNESMSSIDEHYVCYVPDILANAGYYTEAKKIQDQVDKLVNKE